MALSRLITLQEVRVPLKASFALNLAVLGRVLQAFIVV
jgi:hypothetical protein